MEIDNKKTIYHFIYGIVKLVNMNPIMRDKVFFRSEEDHEEIAKLGNMVKERSLAEASVLQRLTEKAKAVADDAGEPAVALSSYLKDENNAVPSQVLQQIFAECAPLLEELYAWEDAAAKETPAKAKGSAAKPETTADKPPKKTTRTRKTAAKPKGSAAAAGITTAESEATAVASKEAVAQESEVRNRQTLKTLMAKTRLLTQKLKERLGGQDEAIRRFVQGYFQSEIIKEQESDKPNAVFLFAGPVGVGKSTAASEAAKILKLPFLKIELSQFAPEFAAEEFYATVAGAADPKAPPSKITSFVAEHPQCVILFNEVDACHPKILSAIIKLLDTGVIVDNALRKKLSFKDVIFIFTTTLGRSLYYDKDANLSVLPQNVVMEAFDRELGEGEVATLLHNFFENNFADDNIIMFNHTSIGQLTNMVNQGFGKFKDKLSKLYGFKVAIEPEVTNVFFYAQHNTLDAYTAKQQSSIFLKNELYEFGRHLKPAEAFEKITDIRLKVELPPVGDELRPLFINEQQTQVLVIADKAALQGVEDDEKLKLLYAESYEEAANLIRHQDIAYCIIDLYYKPDAATLHYLSLDDVSSVGVECFEKLSRKVSSLPLYLLEKSGMDEEDKATFLQRGARQFILMEDENSCRETLDLLNQRIHMQNQVNQLDRRGKVLAFNTAQEISQDGTLATITFYDFYTRNIYSNENLDLGLTNVEHPKTSFTDIVGARKAKEELSILSGYLCNPRRFILQEGKPPKGVLLYGVPEAGKATLAKALAGESKAAFVEISSSYLLSIVNMNPKGAFECIANYFECAKRSAPAVVFLDKLELIGANNIPLLNTYKDNLINLIERYSQDIKHPILFVTSVDWGYSHISSEESGLDSSLLHRMDYKIYVNLPDKEERLAYLTQKVQTVEKQQVSEKVLLNIAERTVGLSVAMLKDFLQLASRNAKRQAQPLQDSTFLESFDEYTFGEKHEWKQEEYYNTAIHEAGHAYMMWKHGRPSSFITIISRGRFGGYTSSSIDEKESGAHTKKHILEEIQICLAGRAAETCFFGDEAGTNTGISGDLQQATNQALYMICFYGMDDRSLVSLPPKVMLQTSLSGEIINRVSSLLQDQMEKTMELVEQGKPAIEALAKELLAKNQLTGPEIDAIFAQYK